MTIPRMASTPFSRIPIFAGADTSYWIRQTIPFAGGGRVIAINNRNGILNNLRSSKEEGQSNFKQSRHHPARAPAPIST